jgi:3-oxoacyl-[acyl-carrier protein] reductase
MLVEKKAAWVTGANSMIGKAICQRLDNKFQVLGHHGTSQGNLTDDATVKEAVERAFLPHGSLDLMVCCAGGNTGLSENDNCIDISMEDFHTIFDKNLMTAIMCCRHVIPRMMRQKRGSIIFIGSAIVGNPREDGQIATYAMAKAALHEYTIHLARQLRVHNITVNCVAPSSTEESSDMHNLARVAVPYEIGDLVAAISDNTYMSGQIIRLDGGKHWVN